MAAVGKLENIELLRSLVRDRTVIHNQTSPEHKDAQLLSNLWAIFAPEMNDLISGVIFSEENVSFSSDNHEKSDKLFEEEPVIVSHVDR